MFLKILDKIEREIKSSLSDIDKLYSLSSISGLLYKNINEFVLRKGKRLRPLLFIIGYLGFSKKPAAGLYKSAVSFELMHDFLLIHDDIIDKSATRRLKPSMHEMLNKFLRNHQDIKFSGQDLSIVTGDIVCALSISSFLSIKENARRKEQALKKFIKAIAHTACGEFIELLYGIKNIDKITKDNIYKIYDLKTASYTFASPLSCGAALAGARKKEADKLYHYGMLLGRAFQIKDDLLGLFSPQLKTGKSCFTDLQEAKKTILIWHAYNHSSKKDKVTIKRIFSKKRIALSDLLKTRKIVTASGALNYAKKEITRLIKKAEIINKTSKMREKYKVPLNTYLAKLLCS
ncbi:MAG: polyprenyl synthetase family protein [Candidatus Omnitrophota bacterium]|nr:polyprenyl synthetase family protein [Candidatus Omnitrophota bacterium]